MKNRYSFLAAAVFAASSLSAQTPPSAGIVYQQAGVMSVQMGADGRVTAMGLPALGSGVFDLAGSPFSATQQSHSLQILGDGTRIETNESQRVYRDSMGRTRVESGSPGSGTVMIQDPVSKVTMVLDPTTRTAQKMPAALAILSTQSLSSTTATLRVQKQKAQMVSGGGPTVITGGGFGGAAVAGVAELSTKKPAVEDLPVQNVNGVLAAGRRTSLTIAAGEIGNDRPIQVVGETWYSSDLQMMVKSSNSDPRFGDTTYELTSINRAEPDPSLFLVPADYVVSDSPAIIRKNVIGQRVE